MELMKFKYSQITIFINCINYIDSIKFHQFYQFSQLQGGTSLRTLGLEEEYKRRGVPSLSHESYTRDGTLLGAYGASVRNGEYLTDSQMKLQNENNNEDINNHENKKNRNEDENENKNENAVGKINNFNNGIILNGIEIRNDETKQTKTMQSKWILLI